MDAWDASALGNHAAADWLTELLENADLNMIEDAFDVVLGRGDELVDLQAGEEGIAAAELAAWISGNTGGSDEFGELIDAWIDEYEMEATESMTRRAKSVVDRVFNRPSELRDQWEENEHFEDWRSSLAEVKARLA